MFQFPIFQEQYFVNENIESSGIFYYSKWEFQIFIYSTDRYVSKLPRNYGIPKDSWSLVESLFFFYTHFILQKFTHLCFSYTSVKSLLPNGYTNARWSYIFGSVILVTSSLKSILLPKLFIVAFHFLLLITCLLVSSINTAKIFKL